MKVDGHIAPKIAYSWLVCFGRVRLHTTVYSTLFSIVVISYTTSPSGAAIHKAQARFADKSLSEWIEQLKSENVFKQLEAIRAIGRIGPQAKSTVPILVKLLANKDILSYWAAIALGDIGAAAKPAIPALMKNLQDGNLFAGAGASIALRKIGAPAIPALVKALHDKDPRSQWSAAHVLGKIGPKAKLAVPALRGLLKEAMPDLRIAAASSLWAICEYPAAISTLCTFLRGTDVSSRYEAAEVLGEIGYKAKAAVPFLIQVLKDEDEANRNSAVRALGKIRSCPSSVVPALIAIVKRDRSYLLCKDVVESIRQFGPRAIPFLKDALKDKGDPIVLATAVKALGQFGSRASTAIAILENAQKTATEEVCVTIALALWRIGKHESAVPTLSSLLDSKNDIVRWNAACALAKIGATAKPSVKKLTKLLSYGDIFDRELAAEALGRIGPNAKSALDALKVALRDTHDRVRFVAATALWYIDKDRSGVSTLIKGLTSVNSDGRAIAAEALCDIGRGAKTAIPALLGAMKDSNASVVISAARALGNLGSDAKPAVPQLMRLLTDGRVLVSESAAETLKKIDPAAAANAGL